MPHNAEEDAGERRARAQHFKKVTGKPASTLTEKAPPPAPPTGVRVSELAQRLGIPTREVLDSCDRLRLDVTSGVSRLDNDTANRVAAESRRHGGASSPKAPGRR